MQFENGSDSVFTIREFLQYIDHISFVKRKLIRLLRCIVMESIHLRAVYKPIKTLDFKNHPSPVLYRNADWSIEENIMIVLKVSFFKEANS